MPPTNTTMTRPERPVAECPRCPATFTAREWPTKLPFLVCDCGELLCRELHVHIDGAEPRVCAETGDLLWIGVLGDTVHRVSAARRFLTMASCRPGTPLFMRGGTAPVPARRSRRKRKH